MLKVIEERISQPDLVGKDPAEIVRVLNTTDFSYYRKIPIKQFEILTTCLGCKGKVPDYIWDLSEVNFSDSIIRDNLKSYIKSEDWVNILSSATVYVNWADHFLGRKVTLKDIE
jgi:hypothetical protein